MCVAAQGASLPDPPPPKEPSLVQQINECAPLDQVTRSVCESAVRERYQYDIEALQHRRESFRWSLNASKIIFAVVVILVFSGLVFAAIQFRIALARGAGPHRGGKVSGTNQAGDAATHSIAEPASELATNLEVSATGVKVSSSVLGVIILAISMAFFYLYARYVYPIRELPHDSQDIVQGAND